MGLAKGQLKCVKYIGRDPETFEEDAGQRREGLKLLSTQGVVPPLIHPLILPLSSHTVSLLYCIMFMYTLSINRLNKYQVYLISGRKCREANNFKVGRHSLGCVCARVVQGWYPATSQQIHLYISLARLLLPPRSNTGFHFQRCLGKTFFEFVSSLA